MLSRYSLKSFFVRGWLCALAASFAAHSTGAQAVSYASDNFSLSDWTRLQSASNISYAGELVNSGDRWRHTLSTTGLSTGQSGFSNQYFFHNSVSYDPLLNGAMGTLAFRLRMFGISSNAGSGVGFYAPVIQQGGTTYSSGTQDRVLISVGTDLTSDWFFGASDSWLAVGSTGSPDFSESGQPISFGYWLSIGLSCPSGPCSPSVRVSDLDFFSVTARAQRPVSVPEPHPAFLLSTSALLLAVLARRRRSFP